MAVCNAVDTHSSNCNPSHIFRNLHFTLFLQLTMQRLLLCLTGASFIVLLFGASLPPIDISSIPEQYRELIPKEVIDFYNTLTAEDKQALKEVAERHEEFQTEEQAMEALKAKSEKLHSKAVELRNLVKEKIDKLVPDAKTFVTETIEKLKAMRPKSGEKPNLEELRKGANDTIEKFKALSEEAKESLKANFPKITGVIQNEKFQALAKSLLKTEGAAPAA